MPDFKQAGSTLATGLQKRETIIEIDQRDRWALVEVAVTAFIRKYPREMAEYIRQNHELRTTYQAAVDPEMKKSNWRQTLSFPVCRNPVNGDEDCLLPVLKRFMPDLLSNKKTYAAFIRRFPVFLVPEFY